MAVKRQSWRLSGSLASFDHAVTAEQQRWRAEQWQQIKCAKIKCAKIKCAKIKCAKIKHIRWFWSSGDTALHELVLGKAASSAAA